MRKSILTPEILLATVVGCVVLLVVNDELDLYVHTSMFLPTILALIALGILLAFPGKRGHSHTSKSQLGIVLCMVLMLVLVKPTTLSSTLAQARSITGAAPTSRSSQGIQITTRSFRLSEWNAAWQLDTTGKRYEGAPFEVEGFLTTNSSGERIINRMLVSCCAVDAQPIQVKLSSQSPLPEDGKWIFITGKAGSPAGELVFTVEESKVIEEPDQPYEY